MPRRFVLILLCLLCWRSDLSVAEQTTMETGTTVEVEGIGTTVDEALKDAFRNAVRQVIGAVVDAETLIRNDEIVEDKVLTYSDGFVKSYEEITGSKQFQDGLHRIKIKAQIERRNVIAKLKDANITMKQVDGKGLFAEVVTQIDAEQDAAILLKKQFEDFPQSCITANVIGKPEIVEKSTDKATVKLVVQVEPDIKAYQVFSKRITPVLEKLAISKSEFTGTFGKSSGSSVGQLDAIGDGAFGNIKLLSRWIPMAFEGTGSSRYWKQNGLTVAVASNRTKAADRIDYNVFGLDPKLQPVFVEIASRTGQAKLQLYDAEGDVVLTERLSLIENSKQEWGSSTLFAGTLSTAFGGPYGDRSTMYELGLTVYQQYGSEFQDAQKQACLFVFSPTFFAPRNNRLAHKPHLTLPCTVTLSLDDLRSVKDVKVEVVFAE